MPQQPGHTSPALESKVLFFFLPGSRWKDTGELAWVTHINQTPHSRHITHLHRLMPSPSHLFFLPLQKSQLLRMVGGFFSLACFLPRPAPASSPALQVLAITDGS